MLYQNRFWSVSYLNVSILLCNNCVLCHDQRKFLELNLINLETSLVHRTTAKAQSALNLQLELEFYVQGVCSRLK